MSKILNNGEYEINVKILEQGAGDNARKRRDLSLLKRASNILVGVLEIPKILLSLSEGHSVVIDSSGHLFTGKISTKNLRDLGLRIAGKKDGHFDINSEVNSDISMLENQEMLSKQFSNASKAWRNSTHIYKQNNAYAELFLSAWKRAETLNPDNVIFSYVVSPMKHKYLIVEIKGMGFKAKFSEASGELYGILDENDVEITV